MPKEFNMRKKDGDIRISAILFAMFNQNNLLNFFSKGENVLSISNISIHPENSKYIVNLKNPKIIWKAF